MCVSAQCTEGCGILDKNSLKGKRTPTVLICSVSVFYCHALRSHPLLSLPLLICLYSTHPTSPPPLSASFFSLSGIPDTFISISHTVIFIFSLYHLPSYFGKTFVCLWLFFTRCGHQSEREESYFHDGRYILVVIVRHQTLV